MVPPLLVRPQSCMKINEKKDHHPIYHSGKMHDAMIWLKAVSNKSGVGEFSLSDRFMDNLFLKRVNSCIRVRKERTEI
jgi:hypothetical protein